MSGDTEGGPRWVGHVHTMSKRMSDRVQAQGGAGLDNFIFPGDATSPAPFGMSSAGLWDDVEVGGLAPGASDTIIL